MSRHYEAYQRNSQRVLALVGLHDTLQARLTKAVDLSDTLRASHVLAVSGLDSYIHELVRDAIMEIYDGKRVQVPGYLKLRITLGSLSGIDVVKSARNNVEAEIREQHGYLAFQKPDKIADAIRCVSTVKLWDEVGKRVGMNSEDVKRRLTLIVDRRNKIAHESDIDPTFGTLWPIHASDITSTVSFLDQVVRAIDEIVEL